MLWFSSFALAAPTTWNSLPLHIRNSSSIFGFPRQLQTFLYNLAVKTAPEMTYTVSGGALNSTQSNPISII